MSMSLAWKAATLILLNVVITFSAGILARNYLLNPELAKVERLNDEKILHQLGVLEGLIQSSMLESAQRAKAIATRIDEDYWEQLTTDLSEMAAISDLSYVIAASNSGELVQVRPGRYFDYEAPPKPVEIQKIITASKNAERYPFIDLLVAENKILIVAADRLRRAGRDAPSLFVAVSRVDEPFIDRLSALSGVDLKLINAEAFDKMKQEPRALSGIRSQSNSLHWSVDNSRGEPVLRTAVSLPPRSYDDQLVTPTLAVALLATMAIWCVAIWLLHRAIISPMNRASATLRSIMEDKDYGRRLSYRHRDEFGRLITFVNRLLAMVDRHTSELESLSLTDPLTELGNRRSFDIQSKHFWILAERSQTRLALIAFDIDYFKGYNDRYGHPAGDKVLKKFAKILEGCFKRASDVTARVGGEEFLVLMQDTPSGSCLVLANRVIQALRDQHIEHSGSPTGLVTASAGVFHTTPDANLTLELALTRVDEILYAAKAAGRNRSMHSAALVDEIAPVSTAEIVKLPRGKS